MTKLEQRVVKAAMRDAKQTSREFLGYVALRECAEHLEGARRDVVLACAALAKQTKKAKP